MTHPNLPDDHDASDFRPDDDPNHDTQSGQWLGWVVIALMIAGVAGCAYLGVNW